MSVQCFMTKVSNIARVYARRFKSNSDWQVKECPGPYGYHDAQVFHSWQFFDKRTREGERDWAWYLAGKDGSDFVIPADFEGWPTKCEFCDYQFMAEDTKQTHGVHIYVKVESEEEDVEHCIVFQDVVCKMSASGILIGTESWEQRKLPAGALWRAVWLPRNFWWDNQEEDYLMAMTPGGEWCIDGRASNCTMPNDRTHRCWVRHGTPPNIHVDKNGFTCQAGAGSIISGNYHGFLHNGQFTGC